jgi:hypothetical protein
MQQDANKMIKQLNNDDLQTATGGCMGCAHIASVALEKSGKTLSKLHKTLREGGSSEVISRYNEKSAKLRDLAQRATNNTTTPPKQGCHNCKKFTGFVRELAPQL